MPIGKTIGLVANNSKIKAKIRLADEFRAKQLKEATEKEAHEKLLLEETRKGSFNKVASKKIKAKEALVELANYRIQCLKEFTANISYGALPVDSDIKEPLKDKIKATVHQYFENNANSTLAKTISMAQNHTPHYNTFSMGSSKPDATIIKFFDDKFKVESSYEKGDAPHGIVSALDLLTFTNQNTEAQTDLYKINESIERMTRKVTEVVRKKIITLMKEEAEISQTAKFLQEGMLTDPGFEIKNKHLKFKANKNTLFREIHKNTLLVNENFTGSKDEYMAESLLQLTIMECMNTLFFETVTEKERMAKLNKERIAFLRKK
jgi:hypothetical protein